MQNWAHIKRFSGTTVGNVQVDRTDSYLVKKVQRQITDKVSMLAFRI